MLNTDVSIVHDFEGQIDKTNGAIFYEFRFTAEGRLTNVGDCCRVPGTSLTMDCSWRTFETHFHYVDAWIRRARVCRFTVHFDDKRTDPLVEQKNACCNNHK